MGMLTDPRVLALLGAGSGIAKGIEPYAGYSRLPQSGAQLRAGAIAGLGQGLTSGIQAGTQQQILQQGLQEKMLNTAVQLYKLDAGQMILRNQPPPAFDMNKYLPMAKNVMSGHFGTQPPPPAPEGITDREQPPPQLGASPTATPGAAPPASPPSSAPGWITPPTLSPGMQAGTAQLPGNMGPVAGGAPPMQQPPMAQPQMPPMQQPPMQQLPAVGATGAPPAAPSGGAIGGLPSNVVKNAYGMDILFPGSGKDIISKQFPGPLDQQRLVEYANSLPPGPLRDGLLAKAADLKPFIGGERPGVPGRFLDMKTGQYRVQPGEEDIARRFAGIQQGAQLARESALAQQQHGFKMGPAAGAPTILGGGGVPLSSGAGPLPTPVAGGAKPPSGDFAATPQQSALTGKDFVTERGTIVPSSRGNQTLKTGEMDYSGQSAASTKTEENWNAVSGSIPTVRARVLSTAKVLAVTEAGGLSEARANASKMVSGMGFDGLAAKIMSAKDRAGVQTILWNSMQESLAYLKTANAGTGGRILNSEFNAFLEHGYSPDMEPAALREGMTQLLGGAYQTGNMIDDYHGPGQQGNWLDANQFQSSYLRKNPLEKFIDYANKELPTFKGMKVPDQLPPMSSREVGKTQWTAPSGESYTWGAKGWLKNAPAQ